MPIKIFHTADVHLGAKFNSFGRRADLQRKEIEKSFTKIIDLALNNEADLFIIAGDLFDSPFPSISTSSFVINQIKRLIQNRIYTAIIAGNHDYLCSNSVYYSEGFRGLDTKYVKFFDSKEIGIWELTDLNSQIIGISLDHPKNSLPISKDTIKGKLNPEMIRVGVFHGSIDIGSFNKYNLLKIKDIESLDCDYVALGDWHNQLKIASTNKVYYSGSPELIASDQTGSGSFLDVEINNKKDLVVNSIQVSDKKFQQIKIDIGKFEGFLPIYEYIKKISDKNLLLEVVLEGRKTLSQGIDSKKLQESLGDDFFLLKIKDESRLSLTQEDLQKYSEKMVIGRFIKIVKEDGEKQNLSQEKIDQALQLGVNLLSSEDK